MEDVLKTLKPLMQKIRDGNDQMFPATFMGRTAAIAREMLGGDPAARYAWEDIRSDFQPRNADILDRRNLDNARDVALANLAYWIDDDGDEIRNSRLARALSTLIYLHGVNTRHDARATRLLIRDIQDHVPVA